MRLSSTINLKTLWNVFSISSLDRIKEEKSAQAVLHLLPVALLATQFINKLPNHQTPRKHKPPPHQKKEQINNWWCDTAGIKLISVWWISVSVGGRWLKSYSIPVTSHWKYSKHILFVVSFLTIDLVALPQSLMYQRGFWYIDPQMWLQSFWGIILVVLVGICPWWEVYILFY